MALNRQIKKLPGVLQTEVQKEFYAATFDQVFSSANVEAAQGFIGRRSSDVLDPLVDVYLGEPTKERAAYQLEPIAYAVNGALEDSNHMFYEDFVNYIEHKGGNVGNHDRLFADLYYSFAPPIDIDKYLNYQNYLWLQGDGTDATNTAPILFLQSGSLVGAAYDDFIENNIIGSTTFNTGEDLQPSNIELTSSMRVQFEGSLSYNEPFYLEGVGRSIRLVTQRSVVYPTVDSEIDITMPTGEPVTNPAAEQLLLSKSDYMTIERGSVEGSAWERSNRWFHEDAVDVITQVGQLQGASINQGGVGYEIGNVLLVNVGDGTGGSFIVTSIGLGGVINGVNVFTRGSGYSFAQADETGVPSLVSDLQWDNEDPFGLGSAWDPDNVITNPSGWLTELGQDETDFDQTLASGAVALGGTGYSVSDVITIVGGTGTAATFTVDTVDVGDGAITGISLLSAGSYSAIPTSPANTTVVPAGGSGATVNLFFEGTFFGGSGYAVGEEITMSDGSIITVTSETGNVVDGFDITLSSTSLILTSEITLTTVSSDLGGNDDFTLTLGIPNQRGITLWDDNTITSGSGSGAIIDGLLASAVSRSNKADRAILEFKRDIELWDHGTRYLGEVDVAAATENFGNIDGQAVGLQVDGVTLTTGMKLIFLDPDTIPDFLLYDELPDGGVGSGTRWDEGPWEVEGVSGAITRFVWDVDASGPNIVLTTYDLLTDESPALDGVCAGDTVTVTQGENWAGHSFYQKEDVFTGEFFWRSGQQKIDANVPALFNLYDTNGVILDDILEYPDSTFVGSEIFSYKVLTQARLNEQGGGVLQDDSVLGIPLETQGFRQLGDVIFENDLEANRENYIPTGSTTTEIGGYYFFKVNSGTFDTNECAWTEQDYQTNWLSSTEREVQRVVDRYLSESDTQDLFPVSVIPVTTALGSQCLVVAQGRRLNTSEFAYLPDSQTMQLFASPTEFDGKNADGVAQSYVFSGITENIQITIDGIYQVAGVDFSSANTDYVITADPTLDPGDPLYGANYIVQFATIPPEFTVADPSTKTFIQATNRASGAPGENAVVEILTCTFDILEDSDIGFFEIPNGLENNPNNLEITEKSWNELTPHFTSIITEQTIYEGAAFGAGNNYRDTAKDGSLGTFALQNQSPMLKAMFCSSDDNLDIVDAIRFNGSEYTRFKNKYIKTAQQLINEGFEDFGTSNPVNISIWVDEIMRRVIRGREFDTAFQDTYMIAWNNIYEEEEFIGIGTGDVFTTSNFVDLEDKKNVMYVYVDGVIQLVDRDYDITNLNPIQITFKSTALPAIGASVVIRLFEDSSPAHIPSTPTKLGLYDACRPQIITDNTYITPADFIIGHDGSRIPAYGNELDQLLLELESRIYIGMIEKFRQQTTNGDIGTYTLPLVRDTHKPGKFRDTRWSLTEWNDIIKQSFFKWSAGNKADYITNGYYDNSDLWTWNYKTVDDIDGETLPSGYWRGIFDYYYDTQTPDTTPWEMLGFHEKPIWWESCTPREDDFESDGITSFMGYGPGPWADTHEMWIDIENGLVRRVYDPVDGETDLTDDTFSFWVKGAVDARYDRPDFVAKYIPVDTFGALKASPLLAIDVSATLSVPSTDDAQADYTWGDWSPIEYAWRTSESYPFALMEALFLARPGEFGEKYWDPEHIFEVPIDNEQIVNDELDLRKRVGNDVLYVHGETLGGVVQLNTGYQVWISSRLRTLKKDLAVDFGDLVRTLDVKLGHKMAAFTDKDTMRVFVEGISVSSQATNLLVPAENLDVALYTGAPTGNYFYGGVLIKALDNNEYQVFGYDILEGDFKYYPRVQSGRDSNVNVGGKPEAFTVYENNKSYTAGEIIQLNGIFYRAIETHLSDAFDPTKWLKLQSLPITGGISVTNKPVGADDLATIQYGARFTGPQEIFDFLIGYGEWQEEQGWTFKDPNAATGTVNNWQQIAKDYLLWVGTSWEEGALIMLSPLAEKTVLNAKEGYPGNVEKVNNGVYSILDKNGVAIDPRNTVVNREDRLLEVEPDLETVGIYGLRLSTYETENIVTVDNTTVFNDIIFDPVLGSRLARLDFRGRRTLDWTGKLEAGGFIITADGLLPNYENMVDSIRNYHNTEVQLDRPQIEDTARHLIGFDERDYFIDLGVLDDAQYQFYQGLVRQKGTRQAIEKIERNSLVTSIDNELNVVEEWALRVGEFGAVCRNQMTEFLIAASEVKVDPQLVKLSYPASTDAPGPRAFADTDVDPTAGNDSITIKAHNYKTGEAKTYSEGAGSTIVPLVDGTVYYVVVVDSNTIQLATTLANATATIPVIIDITDPVAGVGTSYTLTEFPSGRVTSIDVLSATNVYTVAPLVFITNHPDDTTGSGATAISVLDTDGTVLRIDLLTQGVGYSHAPHVAIDLPTISSTSDRAIANINFDIAVDIATDGVILIDIDDETRWITKPGGVACDVAQELWPEVPLDRYIVPNAGYVHKDDVTFQSFNEASIDDVINNTTLSFTHGQTIWVARDATEEFGVYLLDNYKVGTIDAQTGADFDGVTTGQGTFFGGTGYSNSERIIMSDGTEILVSSNTGGVVTGFTIDVPSTSATAGRGLNTLTAVSSNVSGNNDFTLTLGVLNEQSGSSLPGTGTTLTNATLSQDDGRVTLTSLPNEDIIKAQLTIGIDQVAGTVDTVTLVDGGFGYREAGSFTISDATYGAERSENELDAVISYSVVDGQMASPTISTAGVNYRANVDTIAINAAGTGYGMDDVLSVVGGTGTAATATVTGLTTVASQDETSFNDTPTTEGTFTAGTGHTAGNLVTLSDGSTITIDAATISTIQFQDETDFDGAGSNGTYLGAAIAGYFTGDTITMSDGSVVRITAADNPAVNNPGTAFITGFDIISPSTITTLNTGETITQVTSTGVGVGFAITLGTNNEQTTVETGIVTEFTVTTASTTDIVVDETTLSQTSTDGTGLAFALNLGLANQGVSSLELTTGGAYTINTGATGITTTVLPIGGTGATVDVTYTGTGIVVDQGDITGPTGWRRYLGNSATDVGQIFVNGTIYDYARIDGLNFTLSKDGEPIEDDVIGDGSTVFTLMNLRYRTIAERTLFEPEMTLAGVTQTWVDDNGNGLWETDSFAAVEVAGLPVPFVLALTGAGGEGPALGFTYTSDNDIDTWTEVNLSNAVSFPSPGGFVYVESLDTWVAMTKKGNSGTTNLSYSTDDGVTWNDRTAVVGTFSTATNSKGAALDWSPTLSMFVVGGNTGRIAVSSDGQSWTASQPAAFGTSQVTAIHWSAGDSLFYAGTTNNEFASSTDGTTWALTATEPGGASSNDISGIYSIGTRVFVSNNDAETVHYSDDQGDSWIQSTVDTKPISGAGYFASNADDSVLLWGASGSNSGQFVWRSIDNGVNFTQIDTSLGFGGSVYQYAIAYDVTYGFIIGGRDVSADTQYIATSADDGLTWTVRLNEKGTHFDATNNPVTITSVGTTATVTSGSDPFLANGTTIIISGADQSEYNGTFTVANEGPLTLDYTMLSDPAIDTATGTIEMRFLDQNDIDGIVSKGGVGPATISYLHTALRTEEELIETFKFENAYVYEDSTKDTLAQIPVYDPFKGILPGNARQNLTYIKERDPTRYTNASNAALINEDLAFDGDQLGQLWWDTSTSSYLYYEQGTDAYRRDNWGRLFSGSSVDIYEWTRSTVTPDAYDGDGTVRNTTDYVESDEWDPILETVRTFYYYWIKDRTEIPGGINRTVAAFEVANIINNPLANLYQWFSPVSQTGFMFGAVDNVFTDSDNVFQINYRRDDEERPDHVEWELGREGDINYTINPIHWDKMVDSLVGYTDEIDIGAMAFIDAVASFNTDTTGVDVPGANNITTLADHGFVDGNGVVYKSNGTANINLTDGGTYYVEVISDTELALHAESQQANPIPPAVVNPASRLPLTPDAGTPVLPATTEVHTLTMATENALYNFTNALPTAADPERGYLIVPDPALSTSQQLGIRTRPVQTMFSNIQDARRVWRDKVNTLVSDIILRDVSPLWNADMTTNDLWEWVDWFAVGYDITNTQPTRQVDDTSDLATLPNPVDGEIIKVTGTRYSMYEYDADTDLFTLVVREASRLNILEDVYSTDPSLAMALELRELITALTTNVFIGDIAVNNNLVYFAMLNYVFSEQTDLDWAFKSTYIFLDQTGRTLEQDRVFQNDPFDAALEYITEAKPYQTKVRDFRITRQTVLDEIAGDAEEVSRLFSVNLAFDQIRGGNLSVTEMRIAKYEMTQVQTPGPDDNFASTSYDGYSTLELGTIDVRLGAAGRAVNNYRTELTDVQTHNGDPDLLADWDPALNGLPTTEAELTAVATINAAITEEFFFDFQGSLLVNTSFGGLPTLESFALVLDEEGNTAAGTGYVVGEILSLDSSNAVPVSNALIRVATITGSGGILTADLISGGSYTQTPTVDPVDLLGGSGSSAQVTTLIFENGSAVPWDSIPYDQIGFESSAQDESVTTLTGSPDGFATTIPGQTAGDYDGTGENGSFIPGTGYVADSLNSGAAYPSGLSFADNSPALDTITRTDGDSFVATDGVVAGQELLIASADDTTNDGYYIVDSVTDTVITVTTTGVLATDGPDTNATVQRFDRTVMTDGTDVRVDTVGGSGEVTGFTIIEGGAFLPLDSIITQLSTSGVGVGFSMTLGDANETTGTFADISAEETFSGNGNIKEFDILTETPTFFMFAVVDGVEQVLNVDYFFIGTTLTFVSTLDSNGIRTFGAPGPGTDNVELYTYIEAGDLINPQVTAGITEEMVPLDPRENLVVLADTHNVTLNAAGTGYAVGEVLTVVGGTFTTAMTLLVTGDTGGLIDSVVIIDSGEYTVLPGAGAAVTSDLAGNDDATIDFTQPSYSFRLHNDTLHNMIYTRNAEANSTTLTAGLGLTDSIIPVVDETVLFDGGDPPTTSNPVVAWIGTERIVYHGVSASNELTGVIRGTSGTHAQVHTSGTKVYDGTDRQDVPVVPYIYWVNSVNVGYGFGNNGVWRYNGDSVFFTDAVDSEMVSSIIVTVQGTGYAVNDVLTVVGGTFTTAATILVTEIGGSGEVTDITVIDPGEYTVYPGVGVATTVAPAGGAGCIVDMFGPAINAGDALNVVTGTTVNNSYFIKEQIFRGEVVQIDVTTPGTGYVGGETINLSGIGGAVGATAVVGGVDVNGGVTYVNVTNRGTASIGGTAAVNLIGIGDGNAVIAVSFDREGFVLAQGGEIIDPNGVVTEVNGLSWSVDSELAGGLVAATTLAADFLNDEAGNALSIPAP